MAGFNQPSTSTPIPAGTYVTPSDPLYLGAAQTAQLGAGAFCPVGQFPGGVMPGDVALARPPKRYAFFDTNFVVPPDATLVDSESVLTAPRTVTLPPAIELNADWTIAVVDSAAGVNATNYLTITCQGSDAINGVSSLSVTLPRGLWTIRRDDTGTFVMNPAMDAIATKKSNLSATTDPGVGNDSSLGYGLGSVWVNTTTNLYWVCVNASVGAAKWAKDSYALPDVQLFTSSGTWTKAPGATTVMVYAMGAGAGGGSGRRDAAGTVRCGGGGGGGGGFAIATYPASVFSATETVTVGTGGAGGTAQTVDTTNGVAGSAGGATSFKSTSWLKATGGSGASGGTTSSGSGGTAGVGMFNASAGGSASTTGTGGSGAVIGGAAGGGGGSGSGITSADAVSTGGAGSGLSVTFGSGSAASAGASGGGNGGAGAALSTVNSANVIGAGSSGGGGGSSISSAGGTGGAGGKYGSGGGGGGASLNGFASGAGGAGADGAVLVISW